MSLLCGILLSCSSCNKTTDPTVSIVIPTDSNGSVLPTTVVTDPDFTPTPSPIPEYRVGTLIADEGELVYVRQDRNYNCRIVGAAVNGIDFWVIEEGAIWSKILFGENEEGYVETKYLSIVTDTVAPEIHDAFFYMTATEGMGLVHTKFNGRLKIVPSTYTVIEKVPVNDSPGAPLVEREVVKSRIDIYTTANVLLARDTTLYLKNATIRTTPLPSLTPSVSPTPSGTPSVTPSPSGTPSVTPSPSVGPTAEPTPSTAPTPSSEPTPTEPAATTVGFTPGATANNIALLSAGKPSYAVNALLEPTGTTPPTPSPTPIPVEIVIRNGKISTIKGVTLDEDVNFKIGKDKGHVVTESGQVISYEGMFFEEAEVIISEGKYDLPDMEIVIENGYYFEPALQKDTLVDVRRYTDDIYIDMLLGKDDENIAGGNVYGQQICLLQRDTLDKLMKAQELFKKDGYSIIIYDAYRPYSVTCKMYDIHQDGTYVAGKRFGSIHNKGTAVDMSLIDLSTGLPVEMPSPIHTLDSRSNRSNPNMTKTARENMNYMADIMRKCGFTTIASEWWHFTDLESDLYLTTDHKLYEQVKIIYTS